MPTENNFPYVTFELAKLAKKHGYNSPTPGYYCEVDESEYKEGDKKFEPDFCLPNDYNFAHNQFELPKTNFNEEPFQFGLNYFSAPTYEELFIWLDNKKIFIDIDHEFGEDWSFTLDFNGSGHDGDDVCYNSRQEAMNAALFLVLNSEELKSDALNYKINE